jgi:crotonobetainyl-CoA:carnitine CoA-transferase CaiB-like acyl-CoA transferase
MYETMAAYMLIEQMGGMTFEPPRGPALYARTVSPYRRPHRTSDGYIAVMLYTDGHWRRFLTAVGRGDLVEDARFASVTARTENIDSVYAFVGEVLTTGSLEHWLQLFESIDVPAAAVNSVDDLFSDEHLAKVGLISLTEDPHEGTIRAVRSPVIFSGGLPETRPAPRLGEHTTEVLREAGLSMTRIDALARTHHSA